MAAGAASPAATLDLWRKACALEVQDAFLQQLSPATCAELARLFSAELVEAAEYLDVVADARLASFSEGGDGDVPKGFLQALLVPSSRLGSLVEAGNFIEHTHSDFADHYLEDVARACVMAGVLCWEPVPSAAGVTVVPGAYPETGEVSASP